MLEVFKFLVLCLISIFITCLTASWLYTCVVFFLLALIFYDYNFSSGLEDHAISKIKHYYLKVRKFYAVAFQSENYINRNQFTPIMNSINKQTSNFELSRFNNSGNCLSPITNSANNSVLTSRRLIHGRTSTPLTRTSPWQKNSISSAISTRSPNYHNSVATGSSPRYSLSSGSTSPKSVNESPSRPTIQTVTGPLLASTRFNVNLGTYTDTKSPGLSSRIVQYHNELSGSQTSTHQSKYGSPGQFPIVQLYKKELPILQRTTRRCMVRIAPPDVAPYNSEQANTILRDSFVQNNTENATIADTEINTRSVLEALKEISRKRIHTSDDINDISKRQRKNSLSSPTNSLDQVNKDGKRMREDTPPKPKESTTLVNSAPKRICVVNEIEGSLSSSRLMRIQQGQKRKASVHTSENINKQRRVSNGELVSKQTQTPITDGTKSALNMPQNSTRKTSTAAQTDKQVEEHLQREHEDDEDIQLILQNARRKKSNEEKSIRDIDEENSTLHFKSNTSTPVKPIFSEAPLEIMKKNKLAVMLSALGGSEPKIIPMPDMSLSAMKKKSEDKTDGTTTPAKEVVSILSPKNKAKHDKHVTFDIPNNDDKKSPKQSETDVTPKSTCGSTALSAIQFNSNPVSSTATPFVSPVSSKSNSSPLADILPFSIPNASLSFSTPPTIGTPATISNPTTFATMSSASAPTNFSLGPNVSTAITSPKSTPLTFGAVTTTTTSSNNLISSASVQKQNNSTDKPAISFGSSTMNFTTSSSGFNLNNSIKTPMFGGLVTSATSVVSPTLAPSAASSNNFQFNSPVSTTTAVPSSVLPPSTKSNISFGNTATTNAPVISFGSSGQSSPFPSTIATTAAAPPPAFGLQTATNTTASIPSAMFNFSPKTDAKTATTTSPTFNFGSTTVTSQSPAKTGGFKFDLAKSTTASTSSLLKTEPLKPPPAFGVGSTTVNDSATACKSTFTFGSGNTTSAPAVFGTTPTASQASTIFGASNTTTTAPGLFTATTTTTAPPGLFTATTTTATPSGVFGAPSTNTTSGIFGTQKSTSISSAFGAPNTTVNATGGFGTTISSSGAFGTPTTTANTGVFGTTNTNAGGMFGAVSSAPPAFGTTSTTSSFGTFGTPSTAVQSTGFGSFNTPPTTTQSNFGGSFGSASTPGNAFGAPAPTTTVSTFTFGSNSTTATKPFTFGAASTATTTAAPPAFGSSVPSTSSANLFGGNSGTSGFGNTTGTTPPAFGTKTTTASTTFGQQSGGVFGTAPASGFGTGTSGSVFGGTPSSNTNNNTTFGSTSGVVSGAFGQPNQPASTFGSNTNQGSVFGSNQSTGTFGSTSTNPGNTFGGGTTQNTTFGSGFGTNNNNNNNNQTPAFGAFGTPVAAQTPAQASGVFAFGGNAQQNNNNNTAGATPSAANAFQFGAGTQTPKPGGFNFSANTTTPNINFGASTTPSFNATPAQAFGAGIGQFQAPATGMFNIGSGSTAPKQRTIIKARRRN